MLLEDLFAHMDRERRLKPVCGESAVIVGLQRGPDISKLSSGSTGAPPGFYKTLLNRWLNTFRKLAPDRPES